MLRLIAVLVLLPLSVAAQQVPTSLAQMQLSFAPLVRAVAPAVVNIYATRIVETRSPFAGDPMFGEMLRDFGGRPRVQNSLGSGVILSPDGIVVSNYHVVGMATEIRVVLNDRREFEARVLLGDEQADLAILQLRGASDMPYLPLRDSDTVEVGELVLAIGNPFGVGQTVSSGIVSGLARSGTAQDGGRGYFIQTDAPINPGNSGGALIDVEGRLIGVNTAILTRSGGSNGIGFAIPAALVERFVEQAEAGATRFREPWTGARLQAVDAPLATSLGLGRPEGVAIAQLHPESPFARAGLRVGDVVTLVDGQPVNTPSELRFRLAIRGVGAVARVTYARDGAAGDARLALIAPPDRPDRQETVLGPRDVLEGMRLARINPAVADALGLPLESQGVAVLQAGPLGRRVGIADGDILRVVNGRFVESPDEVGALLRAAAPRVELQLRRDGQRVVLRFRA